MSWLSSALRKTGLNKPLKFVSEAVYQPVRGIGRIARGNFSEGFEDLGKGILKAGTVAGVGMGVGAGLGALGGAGAAAAGAGASGAGGAGGIAGLTGAAGKYGAARSIGGKILGWAKDNPELVTAGLGTAASMYGAHQMGQAEDQRLALDERMVGLDERRVGLDEEAMRRGWAGEDEEKQRRMQAYRNVLASRSSGPLSGGVAPREQPVQMET